MLCANFDWNWLSNSGEEDFLISSLYFHYYCVIISPWNRAGPFIWTKLNTLHPRMLCAKFNWNWLSGSGEEDFFNFVNVFSLFCHYLPLEKGGALHLNKLKSNLNPLHPKMLFAKFGWNWLRGSGKEDFFKFVNVFSLFCNYLPLKKERGPSFEQTWIPFTQGCFVPSLVEIGPVVQEEKIFF